MEQESLFARHLTQPPGRIEAFQNSFYGGCNEVDPSGLLFGVPHLREIVIFRVGLLQKHPCATKVAWSNIIAKRSKTTWGQAHGEGRARVDARERDPPCVAPYQALCL